MEKRLAKIGEAAALLGVSVDILRKWEKSGELLPDRKTKGGTRFYDAAKRLALGDSDYPAVCYARVSSHDQKHDLERKKERLETYCAAKAWRTEVISDLGFGMNFNKKRLAKLLFAKSCGVARHAYNWLRWVLSLFLILNYWGWAKSDSGDTQ